MSIQLTVYGKRRIIRDIKTDNYTDFLAYYRGCEIAITEYGSFDWNSPEYTERRNSLEVRGRDGCYIVNTWEYEREFDREALLIKALENILHKEAPTAQEDEGNG